jgi:predicted anti-sigma-YlaC factor YlaD
MEITCIDVRRELSNYIENDISPELRRQVEAHFLACRGCTAVYDGMLNVIRLVSDGRVLELPTGFSKRLVERLRSLSGIKG